MLRCVLLLAVMTACFKHAPSKGGGQISSEDKRDATVSSGDPTDIEVPAGYRIELVAEGLRFPTGVAFGERGEIFVVEAGYSYGERLTTPRIVAVDPGGKLRELLVGKDGAPWNGITYHEGALYVAHGGALEGGRIVRHTVGANGALGPEQRLVEGLPSFGDHHTNGPVVSRDGFVYFGQGTATNAGIVGVDNHEYGWLARKPQFHDIPCADVTLTGLGVTSRNPLTPAAEDEVLTGAFQPFGTPAKPGQVVKGQLPCSGAVMRVRAAGGDATPELVAWGFRNPFGLALDGDGTLFVTDNGADTRGSRPVFGAADVLWRVERGRWYGWPDYSEGRPLTADWYSEDKGDTKGFVYQAHPSKPPEPAVYFASHSAATGLDFSTNAAFGAPGHAFVALFGDMAPKVGKVLHPVGFAVMKVNPKTGALEYFARNRPDKPGPASKREVRGLERPIAVRFDRTGTALYIVDFGIIQITPEGPKPVEGSGRLWRVAKEGARAAR